MSSNSHTSLYCFDEEELRQAAYLVNQAMVDAVFSSFACEHTFSHEFQAKMSRLIARSKLKHITQLWAKRVAVVLLTLVAGATSWLAVDIEARAEFFSWVREVYESSIIFHFFNENTQEVKELPTYRPTWLPDGYKQTFVSDDDNSKTILYQREDDIEDSIIFDYRSYSNDMQVELMWEQIDYECLEVQVGENPAYFYRSLDGSKTNDLIWVDESVGLVFSLNGYLEKNVMLNIADSTKLVNTDKN